LAEASPGLACLWLRTHRLPHELQEALRQRFVIHDAGPKYDGPLTGMSDWTWRHHTWAPLPWEASREPLV